MEHGAHIHDRGTMAPVSELDGWLAIKILFDDRFALTVSLL